MSSHPYLRFSDTTGGKAVGTSSSGGGLTIKSVKVVQIPHSFENKEVVEIGYVAFHYTNIESVFIPKTVTYLNNGAFYGCKLMREVRFESGSKLKKMDYNVFRECSSLEKIDIPSTVQVIISLSGNTIFQDAAKLECVSYLGNTDFSTSYLFRGSNPSVYVSPSYPQNKRFGEITPTTRNGKTCGVSQLPFGKTRTKSITSIHKQKHQFLFLIFTNSK